MNGLSRYRCNFASAAILVLACAVVLSAQNVQVSQSALTFNVQAGGPQSAPQAITLTSNTVMPLIVTPSAFPSWIVVDPSTPLTTPATFQVSINPATLTTSGTQFGSVTFNAPSNSPVTVSITANVTGGGSAALAAIPTALSFTSPLNVTPPAQTLQVTSTIGTGVAFQATTTVTSGTANWLTATVTNGLARSTIPGAISVAVNPAGLAAGAYSGFVTLTPAGGGGTLQVAVTYTVTGAPQLSISPSSISFYYRLGSSTTPAPQQLAISSTGTPLPFDVSYAATSGGNWLLVSPCIGHDAG